MNASDPDKEWLIDREGNAPVPPGYDPVTSEREFLGRVLSHDDRRLMLKGFVLGSWAPELAEIRRIRHRQAIDPARSLLSAFPGMTQQEAADLAQQLGDSVWSHDEDLEPSRLLAKLDHEHANLWLQPPDVSHAATWLAWWSTSHSSAIETLVMALGELHGDSQDSGFLSQCYRCSDESRATTLLSQWMRVAVTADDDIPQWQDAFMPPSFREGGLARKAVALRIRQSVAESGVEAGERSLATCQDRRVRQQIAKDLAVYLQSHSDEVNLERVERLTPYVGADVIDRIRAKMKVPLPGPVPDSPVAILRWYEEEYRPWHARAVAHDRIRADRHAWEDSGADFSFRFLDVYQELLDESSVSEAISWYRSGRLRQSPAQLGPTIGSTLLIVLDGVGPGDIEYVAAELSNEADQLTVTSRDYVFSPPPSATPFTKPAVVMGTTPGEAFGAEADFRGIREWPHVAEALTHGSLVTWSVEEPDKRYHQSAHSPDHEALRSGVEDELDRIISNLARLMDRVGPDRPLQLIITADHGRLLVNAERTVAPPAGLQSHGRSAWGIAKNRPILEGPYWVEDGNVWLSPRAFLLPEGFDYVVRADSNAFTSSNDARGLETFPHGGLYPEEVIVPWIVMKSNVPLPSVLLHADGEGEKGSTGNLQLSVVNSSDYSLTLVRTALISDGGELLLPISKERVAPMATMSISITVRKWPDVERGDLLAVFRLPNGQETSVRAAISLRTRALYRQTDPLAELEL